MARDAPWNKENPCCGGWLINRDRRLSWTVAINLCHVYVDTYALAPTDSGEGVDADDTSVNVLFGHILHLALGALTRHGCVPVNAFKRKTVIILCFTRECYHRSFLKTNYKYNKYRSELLCITIWYQTNKVDS